MEDFDVKDKNLILDLNELSGNGIFGNGICGNGISDDGISGNGIESFLENFDISEAEIEKIIN